VAGFFLHNKAAARIKTSFPAIWKAAQVDPRGRSSGKDLSKFGNRGLVLEACGGDLTRIKDVERIKLYEFFHGLEFYRILNAKE
jgi:hypothetical protein